MNSHFMRLLTPAAEERSAWLRCVGIALSLHVAFVVLAREDRPAPVLSRVTEIELEPAPPAPPPHPEPAPEPEPPAAPPPAASPPKPVTRIRATPPPAAAARVGNVLTAPEPAQPGRDEPVRFVTDPNGRGFGDGLAAVGGRAEHGTGTALVPDEPQPARPGLTITPADRLSRQAVLRGQDGCRGYFPAQARANAGVVVAIATVHASGALARLDIESEVPNAAGFAAAARACLSRQRFIPALDERGEPTPARTRINLRFSR